MLKAIAVGLAFLLVGCNTQPQKVVEEVKTPIKVEKPIEVVKPEPVKEVIVKEEEKPVLYVPITQVFIFCNENPEHDLCE